MLADGAVVGGIFKANTAPVGSPWMWTLVFGHHENRTPAHGYEAAREAAMAAFAKSWRRKRSTLNAADSRWPTPPRFALVLIVQLVMR